MIKYGENLDKIKMSNKILSRTELDLKVGDLGDIITDLCNEHGGGIVFVCVMKGGFMFFSDLIKKIDYPIEIYFI